MKTKRIIPIPENNFTPVKIELTFESQRELDVMTSLFNTAPITKSIKDIGGSVPEYHIFHQSGGNSNCILELLDAIMSSDFIKLKYNITRRN